MLQEGQNLLVAYILLGAEVSQYAMKTENDLNQALRICLSGMAVFIQSSWG